MKKIGIIGSGGFGLAAAIEYVTHIGMDHSLIVNESDTKETEQTDQFNTASMPITINETYLPSIYSPPQTRKERRAAERKKLKKKYL